MLCRFGEVGDLPRNGCLESLDMFHPTLLYPLSIGLLQLISLWLSVHARLNPYTLSSPFQMTNVAHQVG